MNWYTLLKKSALEAKWWTRFYEHLTGAAKYSFGGEDIKLDPNSFSTINDGPKIHFSFRVYKQGHEYRCGIDLVFNTSLNGSQMSWQPGAKLMGLQEKEGVFFVRAEWYVIRDFSDKKNTELTGKGFVNPNSKTGVQDDKAVPLNLMAIIKSSIENDGKDDDGGEDETPPQPMPTPQPSNKKVAPRPTNNYMPSLVGV